jgi:predicted neutral ceramidase superfamily lipid hydrolase
MWPKLLFDLLPHFARLMPDKYFSNRSATDPAQETALARLAENVRGQVIDANDGINRQLREQNTLIAEISVEVTRTRMGVESVEARVARLERTAGTTVKLLWTVVGLLVVGFALLVVLVVRGVR